jgi:hypothetical protein
VSVLVSRTLPLCALAAVFGWHVEGVASLHDGGELAAAAVELGASHPPGQPLHALLGYSFDWLPLGDVLARLALLSASCALLAAFFAARLTGELCEELGFGSGRARSAAEAAALLGLALELPVLRQSLRIEVYTLALALLLAAVWLLVRWARSGKPGPLWAAAFLSGLSMAVHPPHALAIALSAGCLALLAPRRLLGSRRSVLGGLGFGALGLLLLVYLPARGSAGAGMWGDPRTLGGFLDYVSARAFMANVVDHDRLSLVLDYARHALEVSSGLPMLGAALLLWPALGHKRAPVLGLVLAAVVALLVAGLQPLEVQNPDNVAYLAPALALFVTTGAAGLAALLQHRQRVLGGLALGLLALPPATLLELPDRLQVEAPALETLASVLVEAPPPRALVVVTGEHASTTWLMLERVERARPDVAVLVRGLSTSSWHWARLRSHPGLERPHRVGGADPHTAFTIGAVLSSLRYVPVALEQDLPGMRPNLLVGPYAVLDPRLPPGHVNEQPRSMSERWLEQLSDEALDGPQGDAAAASLAVQDLLARRAGRWQTLIGAVTPSGAEH